MRIERIAALAVVVVVAACSDRDPAGVHNFARSYTSVSTVTPTYLGTLPGRASSQAYAINASGQVAGYSYTFDPGQSANIGSGFIWQAGVMTDIGTPPGFNNTAAVDINDDRVVVGVANVGNLSHRAFIWDDSVFTLIPTLGGLYNSARAINNSGQVVGESRNAANEMRAFLYDGGVVTELTPIAGSTQCSAFGINDAGVVVGACIATGNNHAVKWVGGVATKLASFGSNHDSYAWAVNDAGAIVGSSTNFTVSPHYDHAVIWQGAQVSPLWEFPGLASSQAFDINDNGVIAGIARTNPTTAPTHAMYWINGIADEFGIPAGYAQSYARGINAAGVVAGHVEDASFASQAVIWTIPTPPPPPAAPTDAAAAPVSKTRIDVSWTDASSTETQFQLQRRTYGSGTWGDWTVLLTVAAGATSHSDIGLAEATAYEYRVRACNTGGCSVFERAPAARTLPFPNAPTNFTGVAVSPTQVDLTWTESDADEIEFEITRSLRVGDDWTPYEHIADLPANTSTYSDNTAAPYSRYRYSIRECVLGGCSGIVKTLGILTPPSETSAPDAPSGLNATAFSAARVDLSWSDNSDDEWEFQIFRRESAGGGAFTEWQQIDLLPANTTTYRDEVVAGNTTYRYRVRACNPVGCSASSVSALVTTPAS